jgi:hypothetical protein
MTTLLHFNSVAPFKVAQVLEITGFLEGGRVDTYSDGSLRKI